MNMPKTYPSYHEISDSDEDDADCPICMDPLPASSRKYPILCPTKTCDCNLCSQCLRSMFQSSRSNDQNSGGSPSRKPCIRCPICRADLTDTTRGTLLLRESHDAELLQDIKDSQLNAAQLRLKYILDDPEMIGKISSAKRHYEMVKGDNGIEVLEGSGQLLSCGSAAESEPFPVLDPDKLDMQDADDQQETNNKVGPIFIDVSIFNGLESLMSLSEQEVVHTLMTSGDPDSVAQAAESLHDIANMAVTGANHTRRRSLGIQKCDSNNSLASQESPSRRSGKRHQRRFSYTGTTSSNLQRNNILSERELDVQRKAKWRREHPLPVRIPRAASVDLNEFGDPFSRNCYMTFSDDLESYLEVHHGEHALDGDDGYSEVLHQDILDAFRRICIDWYGNLNRLPIDTNLQHGMKRVVEARVMEHRRSLYKDFNKKISSSSSTKTRMLPSRRVVITKVKSPLTRLGIQAGDVITHINGKAIDGNAESLRCLISNMQRDFLKLSDEEKKTNNLLKIVVNAEKNVSEVLRLRTLY